MAYIKSKQARKVKILLAVGFGIALIAGISRAYWAKPKVTYVTVAVAKRDIAEQVLADGTLTPFKTVKVGAQVSGQLQKLHVAIGDQVKAGQLLAEIDPRLAQNELKTAQANVENLRAQKKAQQALLKQYELAYHRQSKTFAKGASARADLEEAQALLESTRANIQALAAQIRQAEVAVDTAQTNLGYTQITAPINGVVTSITTDEGQTVISTQSATTILTLCDLDTLTVKAEISEADVMRIQPGQTVYFTTMGDTTQRYYGKLRTIEPGPTTDDTSSSSSSSSSSSTTTAIYYYGLFEVANPDHLLRKDMTVQVTILLKAAQQALSIPISALEELEQAKDYRVRVLHQGVPETRQITVGITDNTYIQVLGGLKLGEQVILGDSSSISAGTVTVSSNHPPRA